MANIYEFELVNRKGETIRLADYKGKVILVVNTATGCGFTPQYEGLERFYEAYHDKGLEIIDVPCNQFGHQTPGDDEEIHAFCSANFHTSYTQMKKADVNGEGALPLFAYLKSQQGFHGFGEGKLADVLRSILPGIDPDYENNPDIKWNFTKFLISRSGEVIARFEPTEDMGKVEQAILTLLA